jgi:ketosteroid isomerase-like protein
MPLAGLILLALGVLLPTGGGAAELSTAQQGVISANEAFYLAFRNRDMAAMDAVWSRNDAVAVIHPGWPGIVGRKQVMASWRMILEGGSPPKIRSVEPKVQVYGDTAFVVCYEQVDGGLLVATNIFVLEDDAWRMVHHQAGPAPATAASGAGKKI